MQDRTKYDGYKDKQQTSDQKIQFSQHINSNIGQLEGQRRPAFEELAFLDKASTDGEHSGSFQLMPNKMVSQDHWKSKPNCIPNMPSLEFSELSSTPRNRVPMIRIKLGIVKLPEPRNQSMVNMSKTVVQMRDDPCSRLEKITNLGVPRQTQL